MPGLNHCLNLKGGLSGSGSVQSFLGGEIFVAEVTGYSLVGNVP
jgi:hypothetical protein